TPCVNAESPDKATSDQQQTLKKETEAQKLGRELLELLQKMANEHAKTAFQCLPGNQSCPVDTLRPGSGQASAKEEALAKEDLKAKDIQKAIDLIEKGADVNVINESGMSPLYAAVMLDNVELVTLLLQKNANPEPSEMASPLVINVMLGRKREITKLLIENGANVNMQINEGSQTPLMLAVFKNDLELATLLIEKGADVNIQAKIIMLVPNVDISFTALSTAVELQNVEMVKLFLENGADITIKNKYGNNKDESKDKDGKTALEQAKKLGNQELIDLLSKYNVKE
ncbi:ankyrin repeat domain-containing protein, partial [Candidatus Dependentiae bacterium]